MNLWYLLVFVALLGSDVVGYPYYQTNTSYWYSNAQNALNTNLQKIFNTNRAKNVILFLGDGMGITPNTAGRIYVGQTEKRLTEQAPLPWETFPFSGLSKTYDSDRHTTDSASSATAFLCGTKGPFWTVGIGPGAKKDNCQSALDNPVFSIAKWAQDQGKWTGLITTTRVTHATPAAVYAHSANREWEADSRLPPGSKCSDIARQLIEQSPGKNLRVVMGGGREMFTPTNWTDPEPNYSNGAQQHGIRADGRNLIEEWQKLDGNRRFIWNRTDLESLDMQNTDYLMGLFERSHMEAQLFYEHTNRTDNPTLPQMTAAGIQLLNKSPNGYFLLVEGGQIDFGLHDNNAHYALEELRWFAKAVSTGNAITNPDDTLLVVTADHSHVISLIGYPTRNLSILAQFDDGMEDKLNTTILVFANGPSARVHPNGTMRRDLSKFNTFWDNFTQPAFMPKSIDTHGGEDVGVWARGPYSHLFTGTMENNYIAHAMAFALCVGPSAATCAQHQTTTTTVGPVVSSTSIPSPSNRTLLIVLIAFAALTLILFLTLLILLFRLRRSTKPADSQVDQVSYRGNSGNVHF